MYHIGSVFFLLFLVLSAYGQDLGELEYEEMPSSGIIVDDPSASLLVIESTVKALQFNSRAGIRKVIEPKAGTYHVFLPPGVHIIEVASEGYLPLKMPRLNFQPKSAKKFRVRNLVSGKDGILNTSEDLFNLLDQVEQYRKSAVDTVEKQRENNREPSSLSYVLPGLYQIRTGNWAKGLLIMAIQGGSMGAFLHYRKSADDYYETYNRLSPGLSPDRYDYYFDEATNRRTLSNRMGLLAGVTYGFHLVDVLFLNPRTENNNLQIQVGYVDGPRLYLTKAL